MHMKVKILATVLALVFFAACKKDKDDKEENSPVNNVVVSNSGCKSNIIRMDSISDQSCIIYSYDESNRKLSLTHMNAAFNCCPGELSCEVTFNTDTIVFTENESKAECNCTCLYDLNIEVNNVAKGAYFLKFNELYVEGMDEIEFAINLLELQEGTYCVTRTNYPWEE